jgi:hypothetical protein
MAKAAAAALQVVIAPQLFLHRRSWQLDRINEGSSLHMNAVARLKNVAIVSPSVMIGRQRTGEEVGRAGRKGGKPDSNPTRTGQQ